MGFILGLLSSGTFGLIPFFTIPMLAAGYTAQTALAYRFVIAACVMWPILLCARAKIAIALRDFLKIGALSLMYLLAVVCYFHALRYMASGIVATLQFLYPVMVMIIMAIFFHEPFRASSAFAVALAISGVALLSLGPGVAPPLDEGAAIVESAGGSMLVGVTLSLLSGLFNGLYFIGIQIARLPRINGLVMTFYVMVFGAIFCLCNALFTGTLQWIEDGYDLIFAVLLALVTAVFSNLTLIMCVRRVGSTIASIMGVMEPVTAVIVGILAFGEPFSLRLAGGFSLIVIAVLLVMLMPILRKKNA